MMQSRSISRELALLVLGQVAEKKTEPIQSLSLEILLNQALQSLTDHWRETLDSSASSLEIAQQHLLETELQDIDQSSLVRIRDHLNSSLLEAENVLNLLSGSLEFPRLLVLSDQEEIRVGTIKRVNLVFEQRIKIEKDYTYHFSPLK